MTRTKQNPRKGRERELAPPAKKARVTKDQSAKPRRDAAGPKFSMRANRDARPSRSGGAKSVVQEKKEKGKAKQTQEDEDGAENDEDEDPKTSKAQPKPKPKPKPKPINLPTSFKIIAGSYEKLLYGLEGTLASADSASPLPYTIALKPMFIFPAHVSCIKAVAASPEGGKWLATGSADEIVKVWDLRRRKEIGGLMHHEGSITHLTFPSRSHLLSASEDGSLCLFRARDWSVLRALKGHKGRVNAVAVHPSGKVALSVGRDKTLRMWDLMRGKGCASTKLGKEGEIVRWSTDGEMFAVQAGSTIDVYTTHMDLLHTIKHPSRLHDVRFCTRTTGDGELLLAAAEDTHLSVYDLSTDPETPPKIIALMTGHANRVKAVQTLAVALPPSAQGQGRTSTTVVCTVSSDGKIHVYDVAMVPAPGQAGKGKVEIAPVAEYDTKGTRLTCVALADGETECGAGVAVGGEQAGLKRKHRGEEEEEEGSGESDGEDGWSSEGEDEEEEDEEEGEMESD